MGSMTDVYGSFPLDLDKTQRRAFGRLILGFSAALFIISVIAGTTEFFVNIFNIEWHQSRQMAGMLGGIATPILISGVFLLLPASDAEQQLAATGVCLALVGVLLFGYYYPDSWNGDGLDMTFPIVAIYFVGAFTSFAAMFFAVSTVTIRSPSGVIMKTVKESTPNSLLESDTPTRSPPKQETPPPATTQDSGVGFIGDPKTIEDNDSQHMDDAVLLDNDSDTPPRMIDEYCGNCKHFSYRRSGGERRPYCGLHDEMMDDLEACDDWTPQDD